MSMSKRPFNKIRKFEKKENIEGQQPNEQYKEEEGREASKPPLFPGAKKKIKIINEDALKNNEDNHHEEHKISLGSKPNLFKGKREGGNKLLIPPRQSGGQSDPVEQRYGEVPKPTPQIAKKRGRFDFRKGDRENIVIQDEEQSMNFQAEQSRDLNEESTNLMKKPDMKIKRLTPRREFTERQDIQEVSNDFSENRSFAPAENYVPGNIEYREINIEPATGISEGKIDKQRKRTNELKNLLNLETDLYEQTLSIGNITAYEIYINKIKGGFLKNSLDQAFDQKSTNACQTLSFEYADFTNQCPQDYSVDVTKIDNIDSEHLFDSFVLKMAPVIEELIQPTNTITDPPIFLLAFRPSFKAFLHCPYPLFVYHSEQFSLDLIVVGEKLFIAEGEIESVLMVGKSMVAGLRNGYLILWNGENNRSSRLYQQVKEFTNTTNFELPSFCSHSLQKFSPYSSEFSVVSLLQEGGNEFSSLDSTGKIVRWQIEDEQNGSQSLKPISVTELRHLVQRPSLQAFSIKKRGESYYCNTSMGVVILHNNEVKQKLQNEGSMIVEFEVPKRSPLIFTITQNSLAIYNQLYSNPLLVMDFSLGSEQLRQIIIPELEHDNREIIILSVVYITDSAGHIYEVRLLENQFEYASKLGQEVSDSRRDKNVIYRGVNRAGETLETLRLMRDLKLAKDAVKMGINSEKTVSNLKTIIEKNRSLMTLLEERCAMMV